jgi:hypothetical protein
MVLSASATVGCQHRSSTGLINVKVVDAAGTPVPGAVVNVTGPPRKGPDIRVVDMTNLLGVDPEFMPAGTYTLAATTRAAGTTDAATVTLKADLAVNVTLRYGSVVHCKLQVASDGC